MNNRAEQLRQWAEHPAAGSNTVPVYPQTLREIADELESLRAECERLRPVMTTALCWLRYKSDFRLRRLIEAIDEATKEAGQ